MSVPDFIAQYRHMSYSEVALFEWHLAQIVFELDTPGLTSEPNEPPRKAESGTV